VILDDIEFIQIESDRQPVKINAFDANKKLVKSWEFLTYDEAWEAFNEIHDEWFEYKKRKMNEVKTLPS